MIMLWYKAWLDTRWRFVIGLALLTCGAWIAVVGYPRITRLIALQQTVDTTTVVGRQVKEILELSRGFRGYVWTQWFRQTALQTMTLFAILIGSGGILSQGGGGELYTLSLPASRRTLVLVRAALGLGELLLFAFVPSLIIVLMAPVVSESYSAASALVHATCLFVASAAFFSLALLISTSYSDVWRPFAITIAAAMVLGLVEQVARTVAPYGIFALMAGERYFRTARVPWLGLAVVAALSAGIIYSAAINITRRDY